MRKFAVKFVVTILWLTVGLGVANAQQHYTAEILNTGPFLLGSPQRISGDGRTVVGSVWDQQTATTSAAIWRDGQFYVRSLPSLSAATLTAVNYDGTVFAGIGYNGNGSVQQMFIWHGMNSPVDITIPELNAYHPGGISDDGSRWVAWGSWSGPFVTYVETSFAWREGELPEQLLNLAGHDSGYPTQGGFAFGISGDGNTAVGQGVEHWWFAPTAYRACVWNLPDNTPIDLHPYNLDSTVLQSEAFGCSRDGGVIGGAYATPLGVLHPLIWKGNSRVAQDVLPEGYGDGYVMAVSATGRFAVGNCTDNSSNPWPHVVVWDTDSSGFEDLNQYLPDGYDTPYALDIDAAGDVLVHAYRSTGGSANIILRRHAGPSVTILDARMISWKKLRVTVRGDWPGGVGQYKLSAVINGVPVRKTVQAEVGELEKPIYVDFTQDGYRADTGAQIVVPRFADAQRFEVRVTPVLDDVDGEAGTSEVFIPLPVIVVQGLFSDLFFGGPPTDLLAELKANGYELDGTGGYPTLVVLGEQYGYGPTTETLAKNADELLNAIFDYTHQPKTYARKADIVAHSKGGLVARMYLTEHDIRGFTVRRLIMAGTPNTGSTLVQDSPLSLSVIRELAPTWAWFRRLPSGPDNSFQIPSNWKNGTLEGLNEGSMPASIDYYLLFGVGINTKVNTTVRLRGAVDYGYADGDGVVSQWSQLGYQVQNDSNGVATRGPRVSAFQTVTPIEVSIAHGHYGFLDAAKEAVLWALTR
jgi:uncharacterized membrane protein